MANKIFKILTDIGYLIRVVLFLPIKLFIWKFHFSFAKGVDALGLNMILNYNSW